jgi:hypothetical protein
MQPNRTPYGGTRRDAGGFQRTFINCSSPPRRTESSRQSIARDARSSSTRTAQPTSSGGRTTIVQPGEPHWFGTRADFQNCRLINNLCRCQNPDSHGDAWTAELHGWRDLLGRPTTVQQILHRILDHYGTNTVSHEQEFPAYRLFCDPILAAGITENIRGVEFGISKGVAPRISPYADVTHYNGGGHAQNFVGERGLQTVRPGCRGNAGGGGGGGGGVSLSSCGYGGGH